MKVSVVIPVLNECASLPATIAALRACRGIAEIIVADGGSTDGTVAWLQAQPDIVLVRSIRGKGPQINVGAAAAFVPGDSDISRKPRRPLETLNSLQALPTTLCFFSMLTASSPSRRLTLFTPRWLTRSLPAARFMSALQNPIRDLCAWLPGALTCVPGSATPPPVTRASSSASRV